MNRGSVTPEQTERLLRPIKPGRVFEKQGHSHVAGWDIAAHLTRMFGFGKWEKQLLTLELVSEIPVEKNGRTGWYVTYRCTMQLRVFDAHGRLIWANEDAATGSAQNQPHLHDAHDLAMKNAVTYALKRCAKDLGDQFGLSLYNKGQVAAVVGMTLVDGDTLEPDIVVDGEDHDPTTEVSATRPGVVPPSTPEGSEVGEEQSVPRELPSDGEPGGPGQPAGAPSPAAREALKKVAKP